jgi:hypothetical protein
MAAANFLLLGNLVMGWEVRRVFGAARFRGLIAELALLVLVPLPFFAFVVWLLPAASWARFAASLAAAAVAAALIAARHWRSFRAFFAGRRAAPAGAP